LPRLKVVAFKLLTLTLKNTEDIPRYRVWKTVTIFTFVGNTKSVCMHFIVTYILSFLSLLGYWFGSCKLFLILRVVSVRDITRSSLYSKFYPKRLVIRRSFLHCVLAAFLLTAKAWKTFEFCNQKLDKFTPRCIRLNGPQFFSPKLLWMDFNIERNTN
jgi:hypothetical protein